LPKQAALYPPSAPPPAAPPRRTRPFLREDPLRPAPPDGLLTPPLRPPPQKCHEEIDLHPKFFGPKLREHLERLLRQRVEGKVKGGLGFVLLIRDVYGIGPGRVLERSGWARFRVQYSCLVLRPIVGETIDAVVTTASRVAVVAEAGPLQVVVTTGYGFPTGYAYRDEEQAWVSPEGETTVREGTRVRVRLINVYHKVMNNEWQIRGTGTLNGAELGALT